MRGKEDYQFFHKLDQIQSHCCYEHFFVFLGNNFSYFMSHVRFVSSAASPSTFNDFSSKILLVSPHLCLGIIILLCFAGQLLDLMTGKFIHNTVLDFGVIFYRI